RQWFRSASDRGRMPNSIETVKEIDIRYQRVLEPQVSGWCLQGTLWPLASSSALLGPTSITKFEVSKSTKSMKNFFIEETRTMQNRPGGFVRWQSNIGLVASPAGKA